MPTHQLSLTLIPHKVDNSVIDQRAADGFINATAMCQAAGKCMDRYSESDSTKEFLNELAADLLIGTSDLVQTIKGGPTHLQDTWVHPQVAIHLAQWLSPKFAVQVSKWVHEWMSGAGQSAKLPYHLERHMLNLHKIPASHFSVLQEMTSFLVGPLEANGYRLPEHMMPDVSQAKMLCKHLRDAMGINTNDLPKYTHAFPDGRKVEANLYPVEYLGQFRRLMADVWLPERGPAYFQKRDPNALLALDNILMLQASASKQQVARDQLKIRRSA